MNVEEKFIKELEGYLDTKFDKYSRNRILGYLKDYREALPTIVIKEKPDEVIKFLPAPDKILSQDDLKREAKAICKKYEINYTQFIKPKSGKSTAQYTAIRKEFCKHILDNYIATRKQVQEFLRIDHTTLIYYINGKHYGRKKTA